MKRRRGAAAVAPALVVTALVAGAAALALQLDYLAPAPVVVSDYPAEGPLQFALDTISAGTADIPPNAASPAVPAGQPARVVGWAVAPAPGPPAVGIEARLDGGPAWVGIYGGKREDVVRALRRSDAERSGFVVAFVPRAPGIHHLSLQLVLANRRRLPLPVSLVLRSPRS